MNALLKIAFLYVWKITREVHNSLDCYKKIWNVFCYLESLYAQSLTQIKKNCMFKPLKLTEWIVLIFFKHFFFLPNVHRSFLKLERILTLMSRRGKKIELMIFIFILNQFEHIWFKHVFDMKLWILKMWPYQKLFIFMW